MTRISLALVALVLVSPGCDDSLSNPSRQLAPDTAAPGPADARAAPAVDAAPRGPDAFIPPPLDAAAPPSADAAPPPPPDAAPSPPTLDGPCPPRPACDAPLPDYGPQRRWHHSIISAGIAATGFANHRGRDLFLLEGDEQWVLAKFAYGVIDKDLKEEEIDLYLLRGCAGEWEFLGTAVTTNDGEHDPVEGVEDSGGRVYFRIPDAARLGPGRHRVHLVVAGDHSATDAYFEVIPRDAPVVVTDIDGTLTVSPDAEFGALLTGRQPDVHPDSAAVLQALAARGFFIYYLSARPEWLGGRSRELIADRGYPPGILHTTLSKLGATGDPAAAFKTAALAALAERAAAPTYGFGDKESDAQAYANASVDNRIFINLDGDAHGGRRIDAYRELFAEIAAVPARACP